MTEAREGKPGDGQRDGKRSASGTLRLGLTLIGLAIPTLSLVPLGSVWLWQKGLLLHWAVAACVTTGIAYAVASRLLPREARSGTAPTAATPAAATADPGHTPREAEAWSAVRGIAAELDPERLTSRDGALAVAVEVVERVAGIMRPGVTDPVWQFTAPEVLALTEQVSRRLRRAIEDTVPLGDRLTIAQVLKLYRWRGLVEAASTAYDVWRLVRFVNPVSAITHEVRERLSKQLYQWSREHVAKRLAETFVEEVGRAAIDLYGGRLRALTADATRAVAEGPVQSPDAGEPLRILVGGQTSAGKSSLVNALAAEAGAAVDVVPTTRDFTAYAIARDDVAGAVVVDSPGLGTGEAPQREAVEQAAASDLVLWVVAAHRADREIDRAALEALRAHFASRPDRRPPPILVVLGHIDRLRPWGEWQPPYDIAEPTGAKARAIREAALAVAGDLGLDIGDLVPVSLSPEHGAYNVDALWGRIAEAAPAARQARLVRLLRRGQEGWGIGRLWSQAAGAGRVIAGELARAAREARRGG